jgi:hypothetical protein
VDWFPAKAEDFLEEMFGGKFTPRDQYTLGHHLLETEKDGPVGIARYNTDGSGYRYMVLVKQDGKIHYLATDRPGYADTQLHRSREKPHLEFLPTWRLPGGPPPVSNATRFSELPARTWVKMAPERLVELLAAAPPESPGAVLGGYGDRDAGTVYLKREGDRVLAKFDADADADVDVDVDDDEMATVTVYQGGRIQNLDKLPRWTDTYVRTR